MKLTISEKAIETQILTWLKYKRIFAWKNQSVGVYDVKRGIFRKSRTSFQLNGVSDIIGLYKNRALFIEVKSAIGKLSPAQKEFLDRARLEGAICIVARRIEDVEKALEAI